MLSEKPLAQTAAEIAGLESRHSPAVVAARLKVAHHFAFSPEVEWAARLVAAHPEWGPPTRVVAMSTDAYGGALTDGPARQPGLQLRRLRPQPAERRVRRSPRAGGSSRTPTRAPGR